MSTGTGIVIFSHSAQIDTVADAASQGIDLANDLGIYANRAFANVGTPPPAPTPSAASGNEANLSGLAKLFHKRSGGAAEPAATTAPVSAANRAIVATAAAPTSPEYTVVPIGGTADAGLRTSAARILVERAHAIRAETAAAACSADPQTKIISGSLATQSGAFGAVRATFQLKVSVCGGITLWDQSVSDRGHPEQATQKAVDDALATYLGAAKGHS